MPQRQRSPIKSAPTCPLPNCWATSAGAVLPAGSRTSAEDDGPRLDVADAAERLERGHRRQPLVLFVFGLPQPDPGLQPAFARQDQAIFDCSSGTGVGPIQINRQELADRRAVVLAVGERVGAAQHQQAAAALADEIPQQRQLVGREEAGFEVVEHDRMIAVQLVGRLGKAVPQLDAVELLAQPDQDRLVGPLGRFGVGMIEPVEEGAGRLRARDCGSRTSAGGGRSAPGRRAGPGRLPRGPGAGT